MCIFFFFPSKTDTKIYSSHVKAGENPLLFPQVLNEEDINSMDDQLVLCLPGNFIFLHKISSIFVSIK